MEVYKVNLRGMGEYICTSPAQLREHLLDDFLADGSIEQLGVGDTVTITVLEMTQEEIDALPEFQGF